MSPLVHRRQRGAALFVVLILLVVMAWFAVSTFRLSSQQVQIVGNMQTRQEALAAAQRAIEETISTSLFAQDPVAVAATPITTDVDNDGTVDYTALLSPRPSCYRTRTIKTAELDVTNPKDRVCLQSSGSGGNPFVEQPGGAVSAGNSECANAEWDVAAQVDDPRSETSVAIHQGVGLRMITADASNFCK